MTGRYIQVWTVFLHHLFYSSLYLISYATVYMFFPSILISTFFLVYISIVQEDTIRRDVSAPDLLSSNRKKPLLQTPAFFHTGGLHPWILSSSPPVLWRWLSPTSPYRYFPSRRRCVCGVGVLYMYKFLIQRNKEEMGNSRLFEMFPFTFSSHLALSPFTHISPAPQLSDGKKGRPNNNQSIQLIPWLDIPLPRNSVTSCSVASSSIRPSVFWRKRKKGVDYTHKVANKKRNKVIKDFLLLLSILPNLDYTVCF